MAFVLDALIAACWAFQDDSDPKADLALASMRTGEAVVPSLWWFEVRNILVVNERRQRISEPDTAAFLRSLSELRIKTDYGPRQAAVLRLARTHRLSVYDAAYLELAQREAIPLGTLDKLLGAAARTEGVELIGEA